MEFPVNQVGCDSVLELGWFKINKESLTRYIPTT